MVDVSKTVAGGKRARTVARDHQKSGGAVRETAHERIEQVHAGAAACAQEVHGKVEQVERSFAQYVRDQPLKSILIAAGVGMLFGRFWLRR